MTERRLAVILIVDDDLSVADLVGKAIREQGHTLHHAASLFQARGVVQRVRPDFIILDRRLPDGDGLELCIALRGDSKTRDIPILFLSSRKDVGDRVAGLEVGADDYLAKPFDVTELLARIKAVLRRIESARGPRAVMVAGPLTMDMEARRAVLDGKELDLGPKEYDLLAAFVESKGKLLTREALLQRVWGPGKELALTSNVVDVTLASLRGKLGKLRPKLVSVRGFGFRLDL